MAYGYYQPYWINEEDELEHFGIKGMKWGIRRYQNPDGTLTDAGKKRYGSVENLEIAKEKSKAYKKTALKVTKGIAKATVKTAIKLGVLAITGTMLSTALSDALTSSQTTRVAEQAIRYGLNTYGATTVSQLDSRIMGQMSPNTIGKLAKAEVNIRNKFK